MENNKIIKSFIIEIPNYSSNLIDIPRLNCIYEIMINEDFIINIIIDTIIRPNISKLYMYDFFSKEFVENEATIHLNETVLDTLKRKNTNIQLKFLLFSTFGNKQFSINIKKKKMDFVNLYVI